MSSPTYDEANVGSSVSRLLYVCLERALLNIMRRPIAFSPRSILIALQL